MAATPWCGAINGGNSTNVEVLVTGYLPFQTIFIAERAFKSYQLDVEGAQTRSDWETTNAG